MQILNLTPHTINIHNADGSVRVDVAPSGLVARVATSRVQTGEVNGLPIFTTSFGEVTGLPDPHPEVMLVVSGLVAGHPAVRTRGDVFSPGDLIRDENGQPMGCRGLTRAPEARVSGRRLMGDHYDDRCESPF